MSLYDSVIWLFVKQEAVVRAKNIARQADVIAALYAP